jgi:7,8-dihydro-6-hydroxymethylpterin-pyrophosphokinase
MCKFQQRSGTLWLDRLFLRQSPGEFASPYLFLNAGASVETTISPLDGLLHLNAIEKRMVATRTPIRAMLTEHGSRHVVYDDLTLKTPI